MVKLRITREALFMGVAELMAMRGTCERLSVGAVLVLDNRIISSGYVGSPPGEPHCIDEGCLIQPDKNGCQRTIHAETNAILFAAKVGTPTLNSHLYTTHSPCIRCSQNILTAGIVKVTYKVGYRDTQGLELLRSNLVEVKQWPLKGIPIANDANSIEE